MKTNIVTVHICTCGTVRHKEGLVIHPDVFKRIGLKHCPIYPSKDGLFACLDKDGWVSCSSRHESFSEGCLFFTGNPKALKSRSVFRGHDLVIRSPFRKQVFRGGKEFVEVWRIPKDHHLRFYAEDEWRVYMRNGVLDITSRSDQLQREKLQREQGKLAEKKFVEAWEGDRRFRANFASRHEDLAEATDAWLTSLVNPIRKYRIQIKSGNPEKYKPYAFAQEHLVLVVIDVEKDSKESIRFKTLRAIELFDKMHPYAFGRKQGAKPRRYY